MGKLFSLRGIRKLLGAKKPVLVIIGELHPPLVEDELIRAGMLKVKVRKADGINRLVADAGSDSGRTKGMIQKIHDGMKKEAELLRKEGIRRLFIEGIKDAGMERAYAEYGKTHDLTRLKQCLRRLNLKLSAEGYEKAREFLSEIGASKPMLGIFAQYREDAFNTGAAPLFETYLLDTAFKAGVFDIVPVEDAQHYCKATSLLVALNFALHAKSAVLGSLRSGRKISEKEALKAGDILQQLTFIQNTAFEQFKSLKAAREDNMRNNIIKNFIPGSALICGLDHVEPLRKTLSEWFAVRVYTVGTEWECGG